MRAMVAQFNPKIADFQGNLERILAMAEDAHRRRADLLVFPELSVCGYPPMDLLDFSAFVDLCETSLDRLLGWLPPLLAVVVGWVSRSRDNPRLLHNTASVLSGGQEVLRQSKTLLPNYDVFDEPRYFTSSSEHAVWEYQGRTLGLLLCEDMWFHATVPSRQLYPFDPVEKLVSLGADFIVGCSASPFSHGKQEVRCSLIRALAAKNKVDILYVNQVGGNDGLVFDGFSFGAAPDGTLFFEAPSFEEGVYPTDAAPPHGKGRSVVFEEEAYRALVLGTRDYLKKLGFTRAHLGLSGGIDSALVACIAVDALGPSHVKAFALPGRFSSQSSLDDAQALALWLGIELETISIEGPFQAYLDTLGNLWNGAFTGVAQENIQARIRGNYLMAYSNSTDSVLLATGNKSELSTGYCTLYGDMAGGLAVIGDLFKTEVYQVAEWINLNGGKIPASTLTKPPSAELRDNQKDQDNLPPYPQLDDILRQYIFEHRTAAEIQGVPPALAQEVLHLVARSEHKRFQAAPVLKISEKAFGIGRRQPIVRAYIEKNSTPI